MRLIRRYLKLSKLVLSFAAYYVREFVACNLRVARDVLSKKPKIRPGFLAVPIQELSDFELLVLGNLISMTPGTLTVDVAKDRKTLFIHTIYVTDTEAATQAIKRDLETRILNITRFKG